MKKNKMNVIETIVVLMEKLSIRELEQVKRTAEAKEKNSVTFDWNAGSELPF